MLPCINTLARLAEPFGLVHYPSSKCELLVDGTSAPSLLPWCSVIHEHPIDSQKLLMLAKGFNLLHETYSCWPRKYTALVLFNFFMATSKNLLEPGEN